MSLQNFVGKQIRLVNNWFKHVDVSHFEKKTTRYLEIGALHGANFISFLKTYGSHDDSELFCIDPWEDYEEYPEYKNEQISNFLIFMTNINNLNKQEKQKINIIKGHSNVEVLKLNDDFFDIIYIDGNHEPEYVLEDAVLCFRKLKKDGILIFDDYGWGGPEMVEKAIDAFINVYKKRIQVLGIQHEQVFIKKIK